MFEGKKKKEKKKKRKEEQKLLLRYFCFEFKKCFVTKSQAEKSCNIYRHTQLSASPGILYYPH